MKNIEIWGGIECTLNRVQNDYFDQSHYTGHYTRAEDDIDIIATLKVKMLRYPVLWEKHMPEKDTVIDWTFVEKSLNRLKEHGITPIAGLVHHGSGPCYVNFFDGSFEEGLAAYAKQVAEKFPFLEYYTPVNEPLTTARFCGLYGTWYPHEKNNYSFYKILLSECKAIVMAMKAIRTVNPAAKLVQTEDLGKTYSTPLLKYQAEFENTRRWLSYDLLCGKVNTQHYMWNHLTGAGIKKEELLYFIENKCIPHVAGFNYYITSERYLDQRISRYAQQYHGGNGRHKYADVEGIRIALKERFGPEVLLREAWEHLKLPLAITECHLNCTREHQLRWFYKIWETLNKLQQEGIKIKAITAWSLFGAYGWNNLVTKPHGEYEAGVFNVSLGYARPTALAELIKKLVQNGTYYHPVLENEGWWQLESRILYRNKKTFNMLTHRSANNGQPLLIIGKTGTLGCAFGHICNERNIHHVIFDRAGFNITDKRMMEDVIKQVKPWAVINAAGYVRVDEAETHRQECIDTNCLGPAMLANLCNRYAVQFLSFSSDLVFDGNKHVPYSESDHVAPLNVYGLSKAMAEKEIMANNPDALIIRTSSFFGPWDRYNFIFHALACIKQRQEVVAPGNVFISPTYVPDLVNISLDLLLDKEKGIFHVTNAGHTNWADLALNVVQMAGGDTSLIKAMPVEEMNLKARRPHYSVLQSEKGIKLTSFENALERYMQVYEDLYQSLHIAV